MKVIYYKIVEYYFTFRIIKCTKLFLLMIIVIMMTADYQSQNNSRKNTKIRYDIRVFSK